MISSERYSVGSEDGKSISFQKEEGAFVGFDVTIKFKHVIAVIICAVLIIGGTSYYSSVHSEQNGARYRIQFLGMKCSPTSMKMVLYLLKVAVKCFLKNGVGSERR